MTGRRGHRAIAVFIVGVLAACWFVLAPPQLGGSTIYSSTVGNSMEPLFHKGDLALVRPEASYRVHDIVLYESPVLHRPVLHRIVAIDNGHYFFKGDHNDFVDPGYATRADLLGTLWLHIPKAGKALTFIGAPSHAGALAGAACLLLLLGGARRTRRRVRRRGPRPMRAAIRHIHKPRHPGEELVTVALLTVAAIALAVGFTTPTKRTVAVANAYRSTGTFAYSAPVSRRDANFQGDGVTTGEPIFLSESKTATVVFRYSFSSKFAHGVRGTIALAADLSSEASTWHHRYVIAKSRSFTGDEATIRVKLPLKALLDIIGQLAIAAGSPADAYDAVITPTVRIHGYVDGKPVSSTFSPTLPFTVNKTLVKLDVPAAGPIAGATTAPQSAASLTATTLNPSASGSIPGVGPRAVKIAAARISVVELRGLGMGLAALLVLVLLTRPLRRHRETMSPEQRTASAAGCVVVDVVSIVGGTAFTSVPIEVPDFASLIGFARYLERPILRDLDTSAFAVEDGGRLYVWRPAADPAPTPAAVVAPRPARKRRLLRWIAAAVAIVVVASVAASLTAANVVPLSNAGTSAQPLSLNQLAPAACAALNLTHLVVATGGSTTGPNGGDLILGKNGTGTFSLKGGAGDDCIVAGGGPGTKNTIDGSAGSGDVCIGAPGATNTFKNCEATY